MTDPLTELDRATSLIDDVEKRTGGVASRRQLINAQRRTSRLLYAAVAICLLISLITAVTVAMMLPRLVRTETGLAVNSAAIESAIQAREELRQAGVAEQDLPPIPTPEPAEDGVDVESIVDTVTSIVLAEIRNDPRYRGPAGAPGDPCDPAIDARCIGPEGRSGEPGTPGGEGPRGEPGAPCLPSNEACRGPAGTDGQDGEDAPRITGAGPARNAEGVCVFRTTLEDGTTFDAPTREENCPEPPIIDPAFPDMEGE
jgi:hypothetical protein